MAKQTIASLLDSSTWGTRLATKRFTAKTLRKIESDLSAVIEAAAQGKPVPSLLRLARYISDTYGAPVGRVTVSAWMDKLRSGQSIG